MENDNKELQLLPVSYTTPSHYHASPWPSDLMTFRSDDVQYPLNGVGGPSVDLQLSISLQPIKPPFGTEIRITAMESAYLEHVMEMTRREMEMAQSEFTRARQLWERAREEVEKVEKMKESAMRRIDSCMEITCQACRRKFRS
ncbi:hypothetical protein L1987_07302 [Smallanthus sonchifolius]|uniref:Uncharacterized protein n=1 Tax=Smallanthus sonchifolius TaxID=185202 RepID=A0ACB9K093_9ASTR|nr:hypothetical protein L1987_07302 [Smallanthus sonchifolius]